MLTAEELIRFFSSLDIFYRTLLHYRFVSKYGKGPDWLILYEPWRLYPALVEAMGADNAEVFLKLLAKWLNANGKSLDPSILKNILSKKEFWSI